MNFLPDLDLIYIIVIRNVVKASELLIYVENGTRALCISCLGHSLFKVRNDVLFALWFQFGKFLRYIENFHISLISLLGLYVYPYRILSVIYISVVKLRLANLDSQMSLKSNVYNQKPDSVISCFEVVYAHSFSFLRPRLTYTTNIS